jgi:hypothetical protein
MASGPAEHMTDKWAETCTQINAVMKRFEQARVDQQPELALVLQKELVALRELQVSLVREQLEAPQSPPGACVRLLWCLSV